MQKQITLEMIGPGLVQRTALVTLYRTTSWWAKAVVEHDGGAVSHFTLGHLDEEAALLAIGGWVQSRFGAAVRGMDSPSTRMGARHVTRHGDGSAARADVVAAAPLPRHRGPARVVTPLGLDKRADKWLRSIFR